MAKRQARGLLAISTTLDKVTGPTRHRRGLPEPALLEQWPTIVGAAIADQCAPQRLVRGRAGAGGTLHVRVSGPLALELQHLEPQLLERINGFFGYRAVDRLALHQGPAPPRPSPPPPPKPVPPERKAALTAQLAAIEDPDLRAALDRLGTALIAKRINKE